MSPEIFIHVSGGPQPAASVAPAQDAAVSQEVLHNLTPGQTLTARVVRALAPDSYLLSLLGKVLVAQADAGLAPGDLLTLLVEQVGESVHMKLLSTRPAPASEGTGASPQDAAQILDRLRIEPTARTGQLIEALRTYSVPATPDTVTQTVALLARTPGSAALNVEAAAYLLSRGVPLTPQAIASTAELIFEPDGARRALDTVRAALGRLENSVAHPTAAAAARALTQQVDDLLLREPVDAVRLADVANGTEPMEILRQVLTRVQAVTAHTLAEDNRLVRLDAAIRFVERALNARAQEPAGQAIRTTHTSDATRQIAAALHAADSTPVVTEVLTTQLNRAELLAIRNHLLTLENDEVERNETIHLLRTVHTSVSSLLTRNEAVQGMNTAGREPEAASFVAEIPLRLSNGHSVALLKMYSRREGKRKSAEGRSHAVIALRTPNLGALRADATVKGQAASVRFTTGQTQVAKTVEAQKSHLIARLEQMGYRASVSVRMEESSEVNIRPALLDGVRVSLGGTSMIDARV